MQELRIVGKDIKRFHIEIIVNELFIHKERKGTFTDGTLWEIKEVPE